MSVAAPEHELLVGPLLRYTGTTTATVWVETSRPAEVTVLGHSTRTFTVEGHHYALVLIEDLVPGSVTPYDVRLDGRLVWPPEDGRPRRPDRQVRVEAAGQDRRLRARALVSVPSVWAGHRSLR